MSPSQSNIGVPPRRPWITTAGIAAIPSLAGVAAGFALPRIVLVLAPFSPWLVVGVPTLVVVSASLALLWRGHRLRAGRDLLTGLASRLDVPPAPAALIALLLLASAAWIGFAFGLGLSVHRLTFAQAEKGLLVMAGCTTLGWLVATVRFGRRTHHVQGQGGLP